MRVLIVALALLLPAVGAVGPGGVAEAAERPEAEYERVLKFSALRMSSEELGAIIEAVEEHLSPGEHGRLTLKGRGESASVSGDYSARALRKVAPSRVTEVNYFYRGSNPSINYIFIHLSDSWREVTVSGNSRPKVESLRNDIKERLEAHETLIGGGLFMRLACLMIVFAFATVFSLVKWFRQEYSKANIIISAPWITGVILFVWPRPLLGVVVYSGDVPSHWSTLGRIAVVATLVGAAVTAFRYLRKKARNRSTLEDQSPGEVDTK